MKKSNLIILIFLGLLIIIWSFYIFSNKPTSAAVIPIKPALTINEKNEIKDLIVKANNGTLTHSEANALIEKYNKYLTNKELSGTAGDLRVKLNSELEKLTK